MRRYQRLTKEDIYEAMNKLRDAFLAAKDGNQVVNIIDSLLSEEEKLKIGRRILAAEYLRSGYLTIEEVKDLLKIGYSTLSNVSKQIERFPDGFELILARSRKVENEFQKKKYRQVGSSTLIKKRKEYTGITRKDIKR